jgi:hypothetical protein
VSLALHGGGCCIVFGLLPAHAFSSGPGTGRLRAECARWPRAVKCLGCQILV